MQRAALLVFAAVAFSACGDGTSAPDVAKFRQLNDSLSAAVTTHCANTAGMADMASCTSERDRYEGEARPLIQQMSDMAFDMDDCMMAMGRDSLADMRGTCEAMNGELDTHVVAACASADLSVDEAEASRHCSAMQSMTQRQRERATNMTESGGMMGGMMSGGTCNE